MQEDRVVGHMPFNFAKPISLFLQREFMKVELKLPRKKSINELELPFVYWL